MEKGYRNDGEQSSSTDTSIRVGRGILNTIVLLSTAFILLLISCVAFFLFYHYNVPAIGVQQTAHLQYHTGVNPYAKMDLEFSASQLTFSQPYDVIVELVLPDSPANHAIGNFMVSLDVFTRDHTSLHKDRRPAIMTYTSPLISTLSTVLTCAPILVGMKSESQTLRIPVLENYQFTSGWLQDPSHIVLEVSSPALRVYGARVLFQTRLGGLPWFLHSFRLTSFLLFTTLFWVSSVLAMAITYAVVTVSADSVVSRPRTRPATAGRPMEHDDDPVIKKEPVEPTLDDDVDTGSTVSSAQFFQFEPAGQDRRRRSVASTEATSVQSDIKRE